MKDFKHYLHIVKEQSNSNEHVFKIQKPLEDVFTNKRENEEGILVGDCTVCNAKDTHVKDHICKTLIESKKKKKFNPYVMQYCKDKK